MRKLKEKKVYFSIAKLNRFGDILLTLMNNKVEDIHHYLTALRKELERMESQKVRIFVLMVLLASAGNGTWSSSDWDDKNPFRSMSNEIEHSNIGVTLTAKPSLVGKLQKFHQRKQSTAGLLLVVDMISEIRTLMSRKYPG